MTELTLFLDPWFSWAHRSCGHTCQPEMHKEYLDNNSSLVQASDVCPRVYELGERSFDRATYALICSEMWFNLPLTNFNILSDLG